jgi:hypothetical protein
VASGKFFENGTYLSQHVERVRHNFIFGGAQFEIFIFYRTSLKRAESALPEMFWSNR